MELFKNIDDFRAAVLDTINDTSLTYEQQTSRLAKLAENSVMYPVDDKDDFYELYDKGIICDLDEGHAPYAPRYILPDYELFLKKGCKFLRIDPPKTLREALSSLLIIYHHVPSVTRYPVYLGSIDTLLEPFVKEVDKDYAKEEFKWYLNHLDRTINDSFCHANIGPEETLTGNIILDLLPGLQNVTPNMTILYDPNVTPADFAKKAAACSLKCANPAFANHPMFKGEFKDIKYGIASCYNALPQRGGAFTLSRLRLNKIADNSDSVEDFYDRVLPNAVKTLTHFMESKIDFLINKTSFFKSNFLVKEGFVELDRFVGLFGIVGLHECVERLMQLQNKNLHFGKDDEANMLGVAVMEKVVELVKQHKSKYCDIWNHEFMMHAQVGAAGDMGTTPGTRIQIGQEPDMYTHLKQAGLFHRFFPSGTGDHFPFESTAYNNPEAVVDIFKGGFKCGMRYISAYENDGDLIRVTGYLIKKSDLEKFKRGEQVSYDTVQYANQPLSDYGVLERKVRNV